MKKFSNFYTFSEDVLNCNNIDILMENIKACVIAFNDLQSEDEDMCLVCTRQKDKNGKFNFGIAALSIGKIDNDNDSYKYLLEKNISIKIERKE